jgi:CheY-like chemotaxis protein
VPDKGISFFLICSGTGIPVEKRKGLFEKYQKSLDVLQQGTGIGLSLCKQLCQLLNGDIWLDESYDSGIEGYPGTRFVVDLNAPPLTLEPSVLDRYEQSIEHGTNDEDMGEWNTLQLEQLPEHKKVLFVDDDMILRKLFIRAVERVAPGWDVFEASNGETALQVVAEQDFDLIFVDMYMASIEKQLLGTETVRAMRSEGCTSIICGLSANDVETSFMKAGASLFLFKPLPCEQRPLTEILLHILATERAVP